MQTIALYTTETMADWEYAYLTTRIAAVEAVRPGRFRLLLVGDGLAPVRSLGGLPLSPAADLDELAGLVDGGSLAALVIPGGNHYIEGGHERLANAVADLLAHDVPVAAICGATYLLARNGFLDERRHTSNAADFLKTSGYRGGTRYVDAPAVTDRGITTASGVHAVPFTAEVMRVTRLAPEPVINAWEQLYLTGEPRHYEALMEADAELQGSESSNVVTRSSHVTTQISM